MQRKVAQNGAGVQWLRRPSQRGYVITEFLGQNARIRLNFDQLGLGMQKPVGAIGARNDPAADYQQQPLRPFAKRSTWPETTAP